MPFIIEGGSAEGGLIRYDLEAETQGNKTYLTRVFFTNKTDRTPKITVSVPTDPNSSTAPKEIVEQIFPSKSDTQWVRNLPTRKFEITQDEEGEWLIPFQIEIV